MDALSSMANIAGYRSVIEAETISGVFSLAKSQPQVKSRQLRCLSLALALPVLLLLGPPNL